LRWARYRVFGLPFLFHSHVGLQPRWLYNSFQFIASEYTTPLRRVLYGGSRYCLLRA
jgi:hypothetical protein